MNRTILLWFLCAATFQAEALRILGVFSHPGLSHFDVFLPLLRGLSKRGHDLTVVSEFPSKDNISRYVDVDLSEDVGQMLHFFEMNELPSAGRLPRYTSVVMVKTFAEKTCDGALKSKRFKELLNSDQRFDLIITEFFNTNCLLVPVYRRFKAPFIGITSHVLMPWTNTWVGNSDNPAYIPNILMDFSDRMTFLNRVENTISWVLNQFYFKFIMEVQDKRFMKEHLGEDVLDYGEIMNNVSLILTNSHFTLNRPRPQVPAVIDVGGIHLKEKKTLPSVL